MHRYFTEVSYVADLGVLRDSFMLPLREQQLLLLKREDEMAIFANCETIRGVNEQLLTKCAAAPAPARPIRNAA